MALVFARGTHFIIWNHVPHSPGALRVQSHRLEIQQKKPTFATFRTFAESKKSYQKIFQKSKLLLTRGSSRWRDAQKRQQEKNDEESYSPRRHLAVTREI